MSVPATRAGHGCATPQSSALAEPCWTRVRDGRGRAGTTAARGPGRRCRARARRVVPLSVMSTTLPAPTPLAPEVTGAAPRTYLVKTLGCQMNVHVLLQPTLIDTQPA